MSLIGVIGGSVWLLVELVAGPSNEADDALGLVASQAIVLAVTRRLTRAMMALWLAESAPEAASAERWLAGAASDAP